MFLVKKLSKEVKPVKAEKGGLSRVIHAGRIYPKDNHVEAKAVIKKLKIAEKGKPLTKEPSPKKGGGFFVKFIFGYCAIKLLSLSLFKQKKTKQWKIYLILQK